MRRIHQDLTALLTVFFLSACGGGGGNSPVDNKEDAGSKTDPVSVEASGNQSRFAGYSVSLLGTLGKESYAVSLNDRSQVVGNYVDRNGRINAFLWEAGVMRTVATTGQARQINNRGEVVGWMEPMGFAEAFIATAAGTTERLNTLGGTSQALAINDQGEIAGRITNGGEMAFLTGAKGQQLIAHEVEGYATAMNETGQILIRQLQDDGFRTLLWDHGTLTDLGDLGGKSTQGLDINAAGHVVGWAQTASGNYHAFLWKDGVMTDLAPLAGDFSSAVAINDQDEIVLKYTNEKGQGNLLLGATGLIELGNFGSNYAVVNDLNNKGEMVGWMQAPDGSLQAFLASPAQ